MITRYDTSHTNPITASARSSRKGAALASAALLDANECFRFVVEPELDVLDFYLLPSTGPVSASAISALTERIYRGAMDDPDDPLFLAKFVATRDLLARRDPNIVWDVPTGTVLRSVLMKPEQDAPGTTAAYGPGEANGARCFIRRSPGQESRQGT